MHSKGVILQYNWFKLISEDVTLSKLGQLIESYFEERKFNKIDKAVELSGYMHNRLKFYFWTDLAALSNIIIKLTEKLKSIFIFQSIYR